MVEMDEGYLSAAVEKLPVEETVDTVGPAGYKQLLEAQGGGCAICGAEAPASRRLAVDHSHTTGKVRGLLCVRCNVGIGMFGDSVAALNKAIAYLRKDSDDV